MKRRSINLGRHYTDSTFNTDIASNARKDEMGKILLITAVGLLFGAALGRKRSCQTGGCPLTANPLRGAIYGGLIGLLFSLSLYGMPHVSGTVEEGKNAMSAHITELNQENFSTATSGEITLVDFWAPWCGPCQTQLPILEEVAKTIGSTATVAKVNIDDNPSLASAAGVQSIPTLILYKNGEAITTFVGVQKAEVLVDAIRAAAAVPQD